MDGIEAIRNVHKRWLSLHPDATAEQLLEFLQWVLDDLQEWAETMPISSIIHHLSDDSVEYIKTFGDLSATVDERAGNIADDIEAVESLIAEHGAWVKLA